MNKELRSSHPEIFVFNSKIHIAVGNPFDAHHISFFEHVHGFGSDQTHWKIFLETDDELKNSSGFEVAMPHVRLKFL